ncbi:hypothetical protein [Bradyrhizobium sp. AUGA SZCCT0160]|nr:hypothetical protein [Bradyrhizobium sp. AUGA SZCCT0160]MBR1191891.1 hypothetical protein [Bradyrhizobium sp. AUGA SZCCT0160]
MAELVLEAICHLLAALFELGSGLPPQTKTGHAERPPSPCKKTVLIQID